MPKIPATKTFKKLGRIFSSQKAMEEFEQIREELESANESALLADGFEDALVGVAERFGMEPVALYDRGKCIDILVRRDGMTSEDAEEHFCYNVIGSGVDHAPIFATIHRDAFSGGTDL